MLSVQAQQKSNSLQKHINIGKNAYRLYADKENHLEIRNNKNTNSYVVGDTKTFWRWDLSVMPPTWIQEPSTCRAVGELSYIFVADNQWNVNMNQTDVDEILFRLEEETLNSSEYGIIEMDTTYFGIIPDELDNDPKVIFFFSGLGSFGGSVFDGYFSSFNQMTEAEAQNVLPPEGPAHSNECEMLYMSCDPVNPTASTTLSVLSHELVHLIHWGYDTNEDSWVDEGCAELAMVLYGQPDPIVDFSSNPNNNLIVWDQTFSDYVQTMLFFTYLSEQYGASFIRDIIANTQNGTEGINTVLLNNSIPLTFTEIFNNWTIANFLDDTEFETGIYGYENLTLPLFGQIIFPNLPINTTKNINDCAAVYYRLPLDFSQIKIEVTSDNEENSILHLLAYENGSIKEIIPDDGDLEMIFTQPSTYTLSKLVLVLGNQRIGGSTTNFGINIFDPTVGIDELENSIINLFPTIVKDNYNVTFNFEKEKKIKMEVFNITGKLVKTVFNGNISSGKQTISFNSYNFASGMYFLKIISNTHSINKKFIVNR